ncbi:hypothetical protein Zmor_022000 [Zophobas morio]|uniref:Kazal-like domain-containing protein n=1 Tax=Zophobas morio TaxID=2755281 RepID=A0AA38MBJ8_9CUCU|nr:hypothetical protein Zmor_022000 [Zophobas morio]
MIYAFLVGLVVLVASAAASNCPVCDSNDYNPVCASGKRFMNLCQLKRQVCLGKVVLEDGKYEKCPPALSQSHEKTMRMGHIECAEPQNQNFDHFSSTHPVLRFFQRLFTYLTQ